MQFLTLAVGSPELSFPPETTLAMPFTFPLPVRRVHCMLQGIDPWVYLTDVLARLGDHPVNRVHELTPLAWRIAREGAGPT